MTESTLKIKSCDGSFVLISTPLNVQLVGEEAYKHEKLNHCTAGLMN